MNDPRPNRSLRNRDGRTRRRVLQGALAVVGGALLLSPLDAIVTRRVLARDKGSDDGDSKGRGRSRRDRGEDAATAAEAAAEGAAAVAPRAPGYAEVRIVGDDAGDFVPGDLTVDRGQSVTFVNRHSDEHTATGSGFDTGIIPDEGGRATVMLDTPGVFPYACLFHPEMTGVIRVRDEHGIVPETRSATQEVPRDATQIVVVNLAFDPAVITVSTGTTLVWRNEDAVPHTVTATEGAFDSGIFDPGGSFAFTYNEPGAFPYVCQLHPQMQGAVTVEGDPVAAADPSAAPPPAEVDATASSDAPAPQARSDATISIVDFAFEPSALQVAAGDSVVWSNDGVAPHTVTGDFADSGVLDPGQTFTHTFEVGGRFDYVCALHPNMVGTVEIGTGQPAAATPATAATGETVSPGGIWLVELIPVDDTILDAQRALVAFHPEGLLEADFAAAPGDGLPAILLTAGRGEWSVRDDQWSLALTALVTDAQQRFVATLALDGEGQPGADGAVLEGTFTFDVVSADGGVIEHGAGSLRGRRLSPTP
jgi:plastocyanin